MVKHMDLERAIIKTFWLKSLEGHRKLQDNETRFSHSPECSYYLYYEKIYPEDEPDPDSPIFVKDAGGVITVKNSKAVIGTWIHDGIEHYLKTIARCEDKTKFMNDKIFMSGSIDIHYYDSMDKIGDIKTTSTYVFPVVVGQRAPISDTYSEAKREISIIQANHYAHVEKCPVFCIIWVDRNDGPFKIEEFVTDEKLFNEVIKKCEDVLECVKIYKESKQIQLPRYSGISLCDLGKKKECYCRHKIGGTTDQDFPDISPARCPGRDSIRMRLKLEATHSTLPQFATKANLVPQLPRFETMVDEYTEEREEIWYCKICNKPLEKVTDFKAGMYTAQHLWFDHKIRDFRTEGLPGKPFV